MFVNLEIYVFLLNIYLCNNLIQPCSEIGYESLNADSIIPG